MSQIFRYLRENMLNVHSRAIQQQRQRAEPQRRNHDFPHCLSPAIGRISTGGSSAVTNAACCSPAWPFDMARGCRRGSPGRPAALMTSLPRCSPSAALNEIGWRHVPQSRSAGSAPSFEFPRSPAWRANRDRRRDGRRRFVVLFLSLRLIPSTTHTRGTKPTPGANRRRWAPGRPPFDCRGCFRIETARRGPGVCGRKWRSAATCAARRVAPRAWPLRSASHAGRVRPACRRWLRRTGPRYRGRRDVPDLK